MKELSDRELAWISGGSALVVAGMIGAAFVFGYGVGKDLAQRDKA